MESGTEVKGRRAGDDNLCGGHGIAFWRVVVMEEESV